VKNKKKEKKNLWKFVITTWSVNLVEKDTKYLTLLIHAFENKFWSN